MKRASGVMERRLAEVMERRGLEVTARQEAGLTMERGADRRLRSPLRSLWSGRRITLA